MLSSVAWLDRQHFQLLFDGLACLAGRQAGRQVGKRTGSDVTSEHSIESFLARKYEGTQNILTNSN
jgi:hypothetical protein